MPNSKWITTLELNEPETEELNFPLHVQPVLKKPLTRSKPNPDGNILTVKLARRFGSYYRSFVVPSKED